MSLKDDFQTYRARWLEIDKIQREESRSASVKLRWQQLNAAYGMAKGLGLLKADPSEKGVYKRWARLKEKALNQRLPV